MVGNGSSRFHVGSIEEDLQYFVAPAAPVHYYCRRSTTRIGCGSPTWIIFLSCLRNLQFICSALYIPYSILGGNKALLISLLFLSFRSTSSRCHSAHRCPAESNLMAKALATASKPSTFRHLFKSLRQQLAELETAIDCEIDSSSFLFGA